MKIIKITVPLLLLFLMGCQAALGPRDGLDAGVPRVDTAGMQKGCFYTNEIDDWKPLTSVNLIVYAPTKSRPYLLTISPPARQMGVDWTIGFEGNDLQGRLCGRVGDRLVMREGGAESFEVVDVRKLDEATAQQLLSQKESGDLPLVVPPEEASGAKGN